MSGKSYEIHGVRVFECLGDEPAPRSDKDAVNLISAAAAHGSHFLILPADWLGDEFFRLSTRVAGGNHSEVCDLWLSSGDCG